MKKDFVYKVVNKQTSEVMDITSTRRNAREIKRNLANYYINQKYKIVQYAVAKVVR
jgi:hypothetical protein